MNVQELEQPKTQSATLTRATLKMGLMGTPVTCGNRGVLALGSSVMALFYRAGGSVTLFLANRDNNPYPVRESTGRRLVPVENTRLNPKAEIRKHLFWVVLMSVLYRLFPVNFIRRRIRQSTPWIDSMSKMSCVGDIRGGDSFSDIYGMQRFMFGFLLAWSAILVKGSILFLPQTYGPFKSLTSRVLARYLLSKGNVILARDKKSQEIAQDLVGRSKKVLLSPDVAFSLEPIKPATMQFGPAFALSKSSAVIGINVNGLMYNGGYTRSNMFDLKMDYARFVAQLVVRLLEQSSCSIVLIPHTFAPAGDVESDNEASEIVRNSLPTEFQPRVHVLQTELDQHEVKWAIGQCDFFIGSRMHSCIAALSQGVPCVGVAYSMKFAGVFETVGMKDWVVDGRSHSDTEAISRILHLYSQKDQVRAALAQKASEARQELYSIFQDIVNLQS